MTNSSNFLHLTSVSKKFPLEVVQRCQNANFLCIMGKLECVFTCISCICVLFIR